MFITWYGESCVKLQMQDTIVYLDPVPRPGFLPPRFSKASIVACTENSGKQTFPKEAFIITSPGEFEIQGVFFYSLPWSENRSRHNVFLVEIEGVTVAHIGNIQSILNDTILSRLEGADVALIPVGGHGVYDAKQASEVIATIEPRIVIPLSYAAKGIGVQRDSLDAFAKEMGVAQQHAEEKAKITAKNLPQEDMMITILEKQ